MSKPSSNESNQPQQRITDKKKAEKELEVLFDKLQLTEGAVRPPPRKEPGSAGRVSAIDTNIYQVKTADEAVVYRYDVSVTGETSRGKQVDLTKRSESSAVIADRLGTCRDAFLAVFKEYADVLGRNPSAIYYDLQSILYTLLPLDIPPANKAISLTITRGDAQVNFPGNLNKITVEIKSVREEAQKIYLSDLAKLIDAETMDRDRSVLNFIELAVNQVPLFNSNQFLTLKGSMAYFMDGQSFGLPEKELDRGGTKYLASGVQKSATLIEGHKTEGSDPNQRKVGLLLEAKHSPFHSTIALMSAIRQHANVASYYGDFEHGRLEGSGGLERLTRTFKKMQLTVRYPDGKTRRIELKSFDKSTSSTHMIKDLNKSVADYFYEKYGKPLDFPNAHLVCVKQGNNQNYYPPEFLHIADNQVVTAEQMDAPSKASMIKACAVRPDNMKQENTRAAAAIKLHDSEYSTGAGIRFSKNTLNAPARILPPPAVQYSGGRPNQVRKEEGAWRMGKFLEPGQCNNFAVYLIKSQNSNRPDMNGNEVNSFVTAIQRQANNSGMNLGQCVDTGSYDDFQVEDCVRYCAENNIQLCLFITPEYIKNCHAVMKMCEHRYHIVTQDVQLKTARKILQTGAASTAENYVAKTNIKLGGLNYSVEVENQRIMDELKETLYVGICSNQPGSKTSVDRVATGREEKPGVLGYCANSGRNYNNFVGDFYFTQAYRPEFYTDLREIFKLCVERFKESRGHAPKSILFYYTGVSEGQFEAVYKHAVPLIRVGIAEGNGGVEIPLSIIAVQKMNNVRLFPQKYPNSGKDFEFNIPHGTVVDTTIVSPVFSEFYLAAHSALKGTARVPRYTIIFDENEYSMDILEGVTHALSYEHQIVSRVTSLPTPVYVAEGYAQRGRDVFNAEFKNYEHELPRNQLGALDYSALSAQLNYSHSPLRDMRVNA